MTDFLTATWLERTRSVTGNLRRMLRTGSQFVIGAWGQDVQPIDQLNVFDVDWKVTVGAFLGGCVVWLLTTLAAPPADG